MQQEKGKLFTISEVMEILHVGRQAIYNYITDDKMKAIKLGESSVDSSERRHWRIWEKDLYDFIGRHDTGSPESEPLIKKESQVLQKIQYHIPAGKRNAKV